MLELYNDTQVRMITKENRHLLKDNDLIQCAWVRDGKIVEKGYHKKFNYSNPDICYYLYELGDQSIKIDRLYNLISRNNTVTLYKIYTNEKLNIISLSCNYCTSTDNKNHRYYSVSEREHRKDKDLPKLVTKPWLIPSFFDSFKLNHLYKVNKKCIIDNCTNHSDQGKFVGDFCAPCYEYISKRHVHTNCQAYRNDVKIIEALSKINNKSMEF
jgi:hypothetical protein